MVERSEDLCFPFESRQVFAVRLEDLRDDLQGDVAVQSRVRGEVDLAHAAGADRAPDLIAPDA
jgi:hypothetical protein